MEAKMNENFNNDTNDLVSHIRLTRSQVAPDWSPRESLVLVNEVAAVEADCSQALSSYQLWNIIAQNCTALDVPRSLDQCRRKWHELLSQYNRVKENSDGSRLPPNFDAELFKAVDRAVKAREERGEFDPESDTETGNEFRDSTVEIGFKRRRQRSKSERHQVQKPKRCLEQKPEENEEGAEINYSSDEEYLKDFLESKAKSKCTAERSPKHSVVLPESLGKLELNDNCNVEQPKQINVEEATISWDEHEELMTLKLQDLAIEIQAIATESAADYKGAGSQNVEDYHTDFTIHQGDKLIASLGNFSNTLKQLRDLLQECK